MSKVTVIDSIMGSGKTTWVQNELLDKHFDKNILYITPFLSEVQRIIDNSKRKIFQPQNMGSSKLDNLAKLLNAEMDIASTHELFKRFDDNCKQALRDNRYTLILDETIAPIIPYQCKAGEDFKYLLEKEEIAIENNGAIKWIGSELNMRFADVRTLAKNDCLFVVDGKCYLWLFPHEIFDLFDNVYICTYLFDGSMMKYYFDLYGIEYETKSIDKINDRYTLVDYYKPNKANIRERINVYDGNLNSNLNLYKDTSLSVKWFEQSTNADKIDQMRKNITNFVKHINQVKSGQVMWTSYKKAKRKLSNKGFSRGFVSCNSRATNEFSDRTCLIYTCNWYENPEIVKFFSQHNINVSQDKIALANLLQWVWRSNIRVSGSNKTISIYIPSARMRKLFVDWLNN